MIRDHFGLGAGPQAVPIIERFEEDSPPFGTARGGPSPPNAPPLTNSNHPTLPQQVQMPHQHLQQLSNVRGSLDPTAFDELQDGDGYEERARSRSLGAVAELEQGAQDDRDEEQE